MGGRLTRNRAGGAAGRPQGARKANSKRPHEPWQAFLVQHFRKGVETTISQITERLPKSVHAVTAQGFALKLLLFVFTHTLAQRGA